MLRQSEASVRQFKPMWCLAGGKVQKRPFAHSKFGAGCRPWSRSTSIPPCLTKINRPSGLLDRMNHCSRMSACPHIPMKPLSSTFAKRNTAFLALLVWVFTLASGVANACRLEARGAHGHLTATGGFQEAATPGMSAGHVRAVADHDDDAHSSRASCLKACDDVAQSLPKQDLTTAQPDPGLAPLVLTIWTAATAVVLPFRRTDPVQPHVLE